MNTPTLPKYVVSMIVLGALFMNVICVYYRANVSEGKEKAVDEELLLMKEIKCMSIILLVLWLVSFVNCAYLRLSIISATKC